MEALLALFYFGSSMVTGGGRLADQDSWLCIIIGMLCALLLLWLYSAVIELYPGRNYYDNIIKACGKIPGKILVLILSLYSLVLGGQILRNGSEFIHIVNLTETPLIAILAVLTGAGIYILKSRIYVLARVSKFLLPLLYISVFLTVVLSIKDWHPTNLQPMLNTGFSTIAGGSLLVLSLPFGESAICASMFGQLDGKEKSFPVFVKGALLGFIIMLVANLRNLLILGYSAGYYAFPSYAAVSVITLGEFFTRIEVLIGINLLLAGLFKVCVILFAASSGFAKVAGLKDYEPIVASCGLALMTVSIFIVKNTQEMFQFIKLIPYCSLPIQILIPLAALISGKIRNKINPGSKARAKTEKFGRLSRRKEPPDRRAGQSAQTE